MTQREALQFTIARWVLAKIATDPKDYLSKNPCELCELHEHTCDDCMLNGCGICTDLNQGAIKCLVDKDLDGFRSFADLIIIKLKRIALIRRRHDGERSTQTHD